MNLTPFTPLKLLRHSDRVESMLAGEITYPISVELDLSNRCPHNCPWCSFGTNESQGYRQQNWQSFPVPRIYSLIDELAECGVKSVTLTGGGEPLVHREAAAIMERLNQSPLQWGLVTNGLLLAGDVAQAVADGATFVRISLDAGCDETHALTHGLPKGQHQFETILANLATVRKFAGDRLTIGASFCVQDSNFKEVYLAAKRVRDAGGNYLEVRPTFPTDWRGDGWVDGLHFVDEARAELAHARTHLESETFKVIGMIERFDSLQDDTKRFSKCRIGPLMTVIGAEGSLWHCCIQRGVEFFRVGQVLTHGFKAAWREALARKMEDQIDVTKCPRCRYSGYLELIEKAYLKDDIHGNFV